MSNTVANRLATLNALRATKGMAPLKSWKESNAKLEAAIEKLSPNIDCAPPFSEWCRENGLNPKGARAKLRRARVAKVGGRYLLNADVLAAIVRG